MDRNPPNSHFWNFVSAHGASQGPRVWTSAIQSGSPIAAKASWNGSPPRPTRRPNWRKSHSYEWRMAVQIAPAMVCAKKRARWPRVIAHPGLPQTRTCGITAYGSSRNTFTSRGTPSGSPREAAMDSGRGRGGTTSRHPGRLSYDDEAICARHSLPPPGIGSAMCVARDSVVGVVPTQLLTQCAVLHVDRIVPVQTTPLGHLPDGSLCRSIATEPRRELVALETP